MTQLLKDGSGTVVGVKYEKGGAQHEAQHEAHGPVTIAAGGFAADFEPSGILMRVRPDLAKFPTTNGEHCTGDGIKIAEAKPGPAPWT